MAEIGGSRRRSERTGAYALSQVRVQCICADFYVS